MNEYISWPLQSGIIIINREELMILIDRKAEHSPTITTGLEIAYLKQSMSIAHRSIGTHTLSGAYTDTEPDLFEQAGGINLHMSKNS